MKKDSKLNKEQLVLSMLHHIPFDGWSWDALYKGAEETKYFTKKLTERDRNELRSIFDNDLVELIKMFNKILDDRMEENFIKIKNLHKTSEKIKKMILLRLDSSFLYKESVRLSLSFMSLPQNSKKSISMLYKTCDQIWRLAGDTSTDFSFYTKRIILSGVYTSTLLYWINDENNDLKDTELFLERRLSDVAKIGKMRALGDKLFTNSKKFNTFSKKVLSILSKNSKDGNLEKFFNNLKNF